MKVLHIGQMIGGLDVYIRNSITFASGDIEYVIMHGADDGNKPVFCQGKEVREYKTSLQRALSPWKDLKTLVEAVRIIRKEHPNVVTKTLYTPHGYSFLCSPSKKVQWVYKTIERVTRCGAWMLACGESEQELGRKEIGYSEKKALCWHNCVAVKK